MAPYIDAWFALTLVIIGLSHAAQPRLWAEFFSAMKRTGFAPLIIGMYTLPTGLVILLGHNIWAWDWPVFVTIAGWGMTATASASVYKVVARDYFFSALEGAAFVAALSSALAAGVTATASASG